jgi:hypothetical protein
MPESRLIPLCVPPGWSKAAFAQYARHMERASREVRPDYSVEWGELATFVETGKKGKVNRANQIKPAAASPCDCFL